MIPDFPPNFQSLRALYADFHPRFEFRRDSFSEFFAYYLKQVSRRDLEKILVTDDDKTKEFKTQLKQRHFYRSATCFYRSFDLFLAFISLQGSSFGSWAEVTGYYSRFYFIQAFLNLLQANWFSFADELPVDGLVDSNDRRFFVYHTGEAVTFLSNSELVGAVGGGKKRGSHQGWWRIYGCLRELEDFPDIEALGFVLGEGYFNPARRNEVNYSHEYIRGFPELEWFDATPESMMSHFSFQHRRYDRDITNIDRFFEGFDPADCDVGDFYGDEAQMLWCSVDCYLRVLVALGIKQDFITVSEIEALARAHFQDDFPVLIRGIVTSIREVLEAGGS